MERNMRNKSKFIEFQIQKMNELKERYIGENKYFQKRYNISFKEDNHYWKQKIIKLIDLSKTIFYEFDFMGLTMHFSGDHGCVEIFWKDILSFKCLFKPKRYYRNIINQIRELMNDNSKMLQKVEENDLERFKLGQKHLESIEKLSNKIHS